MRIGEADGSTTDVPVSVRGLFSRIRMIQRLHSSSGVFADFATKAQYMIRMHAEILAMDESIVERIRQGMVRQSDDGDSEAYFATQSQGVATAMRRYDQRRECI